MFKKAQAAMEFLMTYGWAILVVLAAIGALAYFGVLNPGNMMPAKCELSPAGLDCIEEPDANSAADTIQFTVTNSRGYNVQGFALASTTGSCDAITAGEDPLVQGNTTVMTLTGCDGLVANQRFKEEFSLTYTSAASGQTHSSTGTVTGKAR